MGCGEGKDAVFLAKNGYIVSAFDMSEEGLKKGRMLAEKNSTYVDFYRGDINDLVIKDNYDIIFSSGVFHYIKPEKRKEVVDQMKQHTNPGGINVVNVFVEKPYIMNNESKDISHLWKSGELFTAYYDWELQMIEEFVFDCNSGGIPHQHCMNAMIAEKKI